MEDNNKNKFDSILSEATPMHLKISILQQAEQILVQNRRRELIKKFTMVLGGLTTASVVGLTISRHFFKYNKNDAQMAEWAQLLSTDEELSVAELSDEEMELLTQYDQLEEFDIITDEEFDFILKEDV